MQERKGNRSNGQIIYIITCVISHTKIFNRIDVILSSIMIMQGNDSAVNLHIRLNARFSH